jgi:hypothetical protein
MKMQSDALVLTLKECQASTVLSERASGANLAGWDAASTQIKVSHTDDGNTQASLNVSTANFAVSQLAKVVAS